MNRKLSKRAARVMLFLYIVSSLLQFPHEVFASEISNMDAAQSTPTATLRIEDVPPLVQYEGTIPTPLFSPPAIPSSAQIKTHPIIRKLKKKSFRMTETVTLAVDNVENEVVYADVLDAEGNVTNIDVYTIDNGISKTVVVKPPRVLKPGKYSLQVTAGNDTSTQDFTWGVLAINTDKSIYVPHETANIYMGVLDNRGNMVCNANVSLVITDPEGNSTALTTGNGQIKVNQQCYKHDVVPIPDYEAQYTVNKSGQYTLDLTASTFLGTYSVSDTFQVKEDVPFDVKRATATRIFPPHSYPVDLIIHANRDFSGKISEIVPASFAVTSDDQGKVPLQNVRKISQENVEQVLGASTSADLALPYRGEFPLNQEFGERLRDKNERDFYEQFKLAGHDGVDIDMPQGTPIYAIDDGKVVLAGDGAYGTTVVVEHAWGRSYYGHLSKLLVEHEDTVKKGSRISLSGNTGITTGPHLHFGIKPNNPNMDNGYYGKIDPLPMLGIESQRDDSTQVKIITWDIVMEKGEDLRLSYYYRAPNISPQFYTIGPLRFYQNNINVFQEARLWQIAADVATSTVITTSYTDPCGSNCYTIPSDWNNSNNSIEVVGPGGNGRTGTTTGGGGGGGGGYAKAINQTFTSDSSVSFQIGTGGSGSATWFSTSGFLSGGAGANAVGIAGGSGGAGSGTAASTTFTGGNGGVVTNITGTGGGGGGGAAGSNGNGGKGGSGQLGSGASTGGGGGGGNGAASGNTGSDGSGSVGGNGGNGYLGTGGGTGGSGGVGGNATASTGGGGGGGAGNSGGAAFAGGNGAAGADMADGTAGTGGGGGGGGATNRTSGNGNHGGNGGSPAANSGAGGGGGGDCTDSGCIQGAGATGANGFIVVTYTPSTGPSLDQLLRHGKWFNAGAEQPFTF